MMKKFYGMLLISCVATLQWGCADKEPFYGDGESNVFISVTPANEGNGAKAPVSLLQATDINAVTVVFFDAQGDKAYEETQLRADFTGDSAVNFGKFVGLLGTGEYTMMVFGYGDSQPMTITSPTLATFANSPKIVYSAQRAVAVTQSGRLELTAELKRIVAQFQIRAEETSIPNGIKCLRYTFSKSGVALNPTTSLATTDTGFIAFSSDLQPHWGETIDPLNFATYFLLFSDEETMDVLVEALDVSETVVVSHNFRNVPFKRNRLTFIRGSLFHGDIGTGFTVDTQWLNPYDMGTF